MGLVAQDAYRGGVDAWHVGARGSSLVRGAALPVMGIQIELRLRDEAVSRGVQVPEARRHNHIWQGRQRPVADSVVRAVLAFRLEMPAGQAGGGHVSYSMGLVAQERSDLYDVRGV